MVLIFMRGNSLRHWSPSRVCVDFGMGLCNTGACEVYLKKRFNKGILLLFLAVLSYPQNQILQLRSYAV
jgi:hypothetical protein